MDVSSVRRKWYMDTHDWKKGHDMHLEGQVEELTKESMFSIAVYCILSSKQDYTNHIFYYSQLGKRGLFVPETVLNTGKDKLGEILSGVVYPYEKVQYIIDAAEMWLDSSFDLPERIIEDVNNGNGKQFEHRDEIAKTIPGIGKKNASFMQNKCGAEKVPVIDTNMLSFLADMGVISGKKEYTDSVRGISGKKYNECEMLFPEAIDIYKSLFWDETTLPDCILPENLTIALWQAALWCKVSTGYNRSVKRADPRILEVRYLIDSNEIEPIMTPHERKARKTRHFRKTNIQETSKTTQMCLC
ncbi:hypothetical protein GQ472_00120 [archaeon]|nr:hypothetical protein [archaeon]